MCVRCVCVRAGESQFVLSFCFGWNPFSRHSNKCTLRWVTNVWQPRLQVSKHFTFVSHENLTNDEYRFDALRCARISSENNFSSSEFVIRRNSIHVEHEFKQTIRRNSGWITSNNNYVFSFVCVLCSMVRLMDFLNHHYHHHCRRYCWRRRRRLGGNP